MNRWATFLIVAFVAAVLLALTGCEGSAYHVQGTEPKSGFTETYVYTDPGTGCEYLTQYHGGLTPRMDRNGKQVCK